MNDSEKSKLPEKDQLNTNKLEENRQKNEAEVVVNSEIKNVAKTQELDTLSFLLVQKEKSVEVFNTKNTYHRKLLAEIKSIEDQANKARDEVIRAHGAMQVLDTLIEDAKGVNT